MQDPCPTVKTARMLVLIATGISFLSCLAGTYVEAQAESTSDLSTPPSTGPGRVLSARSRRAIRKRPCMLQHMCNLLQHMRNPSNRIIKLTMLLAMPTCATMAIYWVASYVCALRYICFTGTLFIVSNLGADPAAVKDDADKSADKWYLRITLGLQFAASTIICVAYSLWEYKVRTHTACIPSYDSSLVARYAAVVLRY